MYKNGIFLLLLLACIPGTAGAATLYLKDGGVIECILARQHDESVYVLVNKYTDMELGKQEVAIKKTFKGKKSIGTRWFNKKRVRHQR